MKTTTLASSTPKGTLSVLAPVTSKADDRREQDEHDQVVERDLDQRVWAGSPSVRYDQTNTIAVQGRRGQMIEPAGTGWRASSPIQG